ncbi:hypothetical protein P7C70_g8826, partial [Phenoliferia sp. Uapishka_3]
MSLLDFTTPARQISALAIPPSAPGQLPSPTSYFGANSSFPTTSFADFSLYPSHDLPISPDPSPETPPSYSSSASSDRESSPETSYLGTPGASPTISNADLPYPLRATKGQGYNQPQQYYNQQLQSGYYNSPLPLLQTKYNGSNVGCLTETAGVASANEVRFLFWSPLLLDLGSRSGFRLMFTNISPRRQSYATSYSTDPYAQNIAGLPQGGLAAAQHAQLVQAQHAQQYQATQHYASQSPLAVPMIYHPIPQFQQAHSPSPYSGQVAPPLHQQQFYPVLPPHVHSQPQYQQVTAPVAQAVPYAYPAPSFETAQGTYYFVPNSNSAPAVVSPLARGHSVSASVGSSASWGEDESKPSVGSVKKAKKNAGKNQTKRFICPHPECGRGFARNFNMQSHLKSHLGIRDCALSSSTFKLHVWLSADLHYNLVPCSHCSKMFSRRHDRARHCAAVHDSHVENDEHDEQGTEHDDFETFEG